jgi:hypothetical protein
MLAALFGVQVALRHAGVSEAITVVAGIIAGAIVVAVTVGVGLFDGSWGRSARPEPPQGAGQTPDK